MKNNNNISLRITFGNQLKMLSDFNILLLLYLIVYIYFRQIQIDFDKGMYILFGCFFFYFMFPALFLQVEYFIRNVGEKYELKKNIIEYHTKNNEHFVLDNKTIKRIVIYASPNYIRKDIRLSAFENYHFAKVELHTGKILYLTSLLAPSGIDKVFDVYLKEIPYIKKKRLFCTTLY